MKNIKVYIKKGCPWCVDLENFLEENNVEHELIDVLTNPTKFEEMIAISGQNKAPTVVIDEEIFADTDREAIEKVLITKGII